MTTRDIGPMHYVPYIYTPSDLTTAGPLKKEMNQVLKAINYLSFKLDPTSSREDYLNWVDVWKYNYRKLSLFINMVKRYRDDRSLNDNWLSYHSFRRRDAEELRRAANIMLNLRDVYKIVSKVRATEEYEIGNSN